MSGFPLRPRLNPVLGRELKQRMRGRHVWLVLTVYLAVLAVILRWVYVAASRTDIFGDGGNGLASASAGRSIFQWLLFFMLLLVCFIVPGLTAGAISGERERQTLVALQLTLLRPRSIVVGKLLASLAFVVLLIVASLPLVTVPFLVGGVSLSEVVKGLVMVLATAVTLACLTLACSAVLRRTQAATVVAYGVTLALALGTLMVYGAQQIPRGPNTRRPEPWILALNPFAATADVVKGRSDSSGFQSPFQPLQSLLRLSAEDRISQIVNGPGFSTGGAGFGVAPAIAVPPTITVVPAPLPATRVPAVTVPLIGTVPETTVPGLAPSPAPPRPTAPLVAAVNGGDVSSSGVGAGGGSAGPAVIVGGNSFSTGVGGAPTLSGVRIDDSVRLGGVRFWVIALGAWFVLAAGAVFLTVRRISLPAAREAS